MIIQNIDESVCNEGKRLSAWHSPENLFDGCLRLDAGVRVGVVLRTNACTRKCLFNIPFLDGSFLALVCSIPARLAVMVLVLPLAEDLD